jgi:predicted  nucleic acid-binding Zn-ribbon protein
VEGDFRVHWPSASPQWLVLQGKFMSLQTTHNTTTTSLQRELDKLRQEHQALKVQFRELEMGNDDLERNERAVTSSLADVESKYSRALEEKILLEHELLDKANLEEECQRLKDELRGTCTARRTNACSYRLL